MYERLQQRAPIDLATLSLEGLMAVIDHSLLRPELSLEEVERGLEVALSHNTATVCVRPCDLALAVERLKGSDVAPSTVVGFPHGSHTTKIKVEEAKRAADEGAIELDVVVNIGALRSGFYDAVQRELEAIITAVSPIAVKVILETAYLTPEQVERGCLIAKAAGAAFVKNGTGFSPRGASADEIRTMREVVGPSVGVKAAGGVRTLDSALQMLAAGANRIGATATQAIAEEWKLKQPTSSGLLQIATGNS
jgi:deoxyribose-phosphate aldolase